MKNRLRRPFAIVAICFAVITACVLLSFLIDRLGYAGKMMSSLASAVTPFLVGGTFAFILKPICNLLDEPIGNFYVKHVFKRRLQRGRTTERRIRRTAEMTSILIAMLCLFVALYALLHSILPQLIDSITLLATNIPSYITRFSNWLIGLVGDKDPALTEKISAFFGEITSDFPSWLQNTAKPYLEKMLLGDSDTKLVVDIISGTLNVGLEVVNLLLDAIVSIFVTVYALAGRKKFAQQGKLLICSAFPKKWADLILEEISYINFVFSHYISGRLLDCMIVGLLVFIACSIVQIPQAALVSIMVGASNIVPFFGPYIGTIPSALIILMIDPIKFIYFVILVLIIQQIDSNVLDPFVVGNSINMSSFWILFSVLLFGGLYGFAGLLLGVPAFAIFYDIVRKLTNYALKKRGETEVLEAYQATFHDPTEERSFLRERAKSIKLEKKALEATERQVQLDLVSSLVKEAQESGTTEAEPIVETTSSDSDEPEITIPIPIHAIETETETETETVEEGEESTEQAP